jgi:HEAT repeat protein
MSRDLYHRRSAAWPGFLLGLLCLAAGVRPAAAEDPVEALREALQANPEKAEARKRLLTPRAEAVRSLAELRQALALEEWRDLDPDENVAGVDQPIRAALVRRFERDVRQTLQKGDDTARQAVVQMLAEIGTGVRGADTTAGLARPFGPDLAALVKKGTPAVRDAAARALGKINPDPAVAVPALNDGLGADDVSARVAAADGLFSLVETASWLATRPSPGAVVSPQDVFTLVRAAAPVAARALRDASPDVRRRGADTLREAAVAASRMVPDPRRPEEQKDPEDIRRRAEETQTALRPLFTALAGQVPSLSRVVGDADQPARLAANAALEALAVARGRWVHLGGDPADDPLRDALREALRPLADELRHPEVRVRLAGLYVLETLGKLAAPVAGDLVKALADDDAFVRWGAARAVGRMAPVETGAAVPALAERLADANGDVRVTAAAALRRFGRDAAAAVPALRRAAGQGPPAWRAAVLDVLAAVGPAARDAVPELRTALAAPDAEVRRAAAQALGKVAPAEAAVREALRQRLNDPDADVRQAAADALLGRE